MGILAATIIHGEFNSKGLRLKKPSKLMKTEDILSRSPIIKIHEYISSLARKFTKMVLKPLKELRFPYTLP